MSGVVRWEDPPESRQLSAVVLAHNLIAVQLKRRPGQWAVIAESPSNLGLVSHIANGKYAPYRPAGSFEAVSRNVNGVYCVYARYIDETPP